MKRVSLFFLICAFFIVFGIIALADNVVSVEINGVPIEFDVAPRIINDRTMVPMRKIFESLGATVTWNEETETATGVKDGTTVEITINSSILYKNGEVIELDSPAVLAEDRTLVPVRAVAESFGCKVLWDDATQTVMIDTSSADQKVTETIVVDGKKHYMTFCDNFNGTELDFEKWSFSPEMQRQDAGGRWDNSMAFLDGNGNLVIRSAVDANGIPVSGSVRTKDKFEQTTGYFEIRCKLQKARGFWGAFWLMCDGEYSVGNGAKDGVEIDIFESCSAENKMVHHALHWDGYLENHRSTAKSIYAPECYDGEFHTFSMLWTDKEYVFYIDGKETYRVDEKNPEFPGACTVPVYMKISSEFGSWAGAHNPSELPDDIVVDYVKVYIAQ